MKILSVIEGVISCLLLIGCYDNKEVSHSSTPQITIQKTAPGVYKGISPDGSDYVYQIVIPKGYSEDDAQYDSIARKVMERSYREGLFKTSSEREYELPTEEPLPWDKIQDAKLLEILQNDENSQQEMVEYVLMKDTMIFPYIPLGDNMQAERNSIGKELELKRELYYKEVETEMQVVYGAKFEVVNSFWLLCMRQYKASAADFLKMAQHPQVISIVSNPTATFD